MMTISSGGVLFLILLGAVAGFTFRHLIARSDKKFEREQRKLVAALDTKIDEALGITELPPIRVDNVTREELTAKAKARSLIVQAYVRELIRKDLESNT